MIVRISGTGQYDINQDAVKQLDSLDTFLTQALHDRNETRFRELLAQVIGLIESQGSPVSDDTVVPSEVIVPPDDITLEEAQRFFTDEGLMAPIPA